MTTAAVSRVDLFCLPCAGASATMYLRWRRRLPAWIRLVPLELPGRGARLGEDFVENFDDLVARIHGEMMPMIQGPYALFGHSMGALLAYGLAQRLRFSPVSSLRALLVSGSQAPLYCNSRRLPAKEDEAALIADLRRHGGTPEEVFASPELLAMTLDALGADYRVCESFDYHPAVPLGIPVHVFAGRQDIERQLAEPWRGETEGPCAIHWFDGGHFFIHRGEELVLRRVVDVLEAARLCTEEPHAGAATA